MCTLPEGTVIFLSFFPESVMGRWYQLAINQVNLSRFDFSVLCFSSFSFTLFQASLRPAGFVHL